jgi:hypothetical protein
MVWFLRVVALTLVVLGVHGVAVGAGGVKRVAVFDFELIDTSLQG